MLVGDETDDIDVEAEICCMMGFDPATYALVEGLIEVNAEEALRMGPQSVSN